MRSAHLGAISASGYLEMNPYDARDLGLKEGERVRVFNNQAEVSMVLKLTESVPKGLVFCPSFDRSSSALIPLSLDPSSINICRVRIDKET